MIHPGVDLGTTFSLIGHVNPHGQPALFPDAGDANLFRTPSLVHIGRDGVLVGQPALELLDERPELPVARGIKRHLAEPDWSYTDHLGRRWSASALSALLLRKLLRDAQAFGADDVGACVIAVPARFGDAERRRTLRAARLAGLGAVQLVEEPVAAALHYGHAEWRGDATWLVFDFGGGTFDVTLLQATPDKLLVLANDGVNDLGGLELDAALAEAAFPQAPADAPTRQRLLRIAEQAKVRLSTQPAVEMVRQPLVVDGRMHEFVLTRARFEALAEAFAERAVQACERCLRAAGLGWRDVERVLLAGGSSLLPAVRRALQHASGLAAQDLVSRQPHHAVAYGAATLAARLGAGLDMDSMVRAVSGSDLCLRVWDPAIGAPALETLIERQSPLPARYARTFYTRRPDQTRLVLEFVQRRGDPEAVVSLGHFAFGPLPAPRRNLPVEVTVELGADGIVHATAVDRDSGLRLQQTLREDGVAVSDDDTGDATLVAGARINA